MRKSQSIGIKFSIAKGKVLFYRCMVVLRHAYIDHAIVVIKASNPLRKEVGERNFNLVSQVERYGPYDH